MVVGYQACWLLPCSVIKAFGCERQFWHHAIDCFIMIMIREMLQLLAGQSPTSHGRACSPCRNMPDYQLANYPQSPLRNPLGHQQYMRPDLGLLILALGEIQRAVSLALQAG